jgi:zinc and cadmium transporter
MMAYDVWLYTLVSVIGVSVLSFSGLLFLTLQKNFLEKIMLFLVSFSVGALLGDAFLHIFPGAIEAGALPLAFGMSALVGFLIFFVIEKFLRWHHRHLFEHVEDDHHAHTLTKPYVWMNLLGDGVHNFIDGMIIAGSYLVSVPLGITTTLAVVFHEGAQEIGDFAILIKGGLSHSKALFYNFLSALAAIVGGVLTLIVGSRVAGVTQFLVPFTFAGFTYIAMATLIPELHHEDTFKKLIVQVVGIILGVAVMAALLLLE